MQNKEQEQAKDFATMNIDELDALCKGPEYTPPEIGGIIDGADDDLDLAPGKPKLLIGTNDDRDVRELCRALADAGVVRIDKVLGIVQELPDAKGRPRVAFAPIGAAHVRRIVAEHLDLVRIVKEEVKPAKLTRDAAQMIIDAPQLDSFPALRGISPGPLLRHDGSVATSAGLDPASGYFIDTAGKEWPDFGDPPDREAARVYAGELLELVGDFPWRSAADQAGWLGLLLTIAARPMIPGHVPLFLLDAPCRGAGKTLSLDVAVALVTGRAPIHSRWPHDPAEQEKSLVALLLESPPIFFFDNVEGKFGGGGGALEAVITSETMKARILGFMKTGEVSVGSTTFVCTGNNIEVAGDMVRRIVHFRLVPRVESPWRERRTFRFPRLLEHVENHRVELYAKIVEILRAHISAGAPGPPESWAPFGGFDSWSERVRGCLAWLGQPDPLSNLVELDEADPARAWLVRLLPALAHALPQGGSSKEILDACPHFPDLRDVIAEVDAKGDLPSPAKLAGRLRRHVDAVAEGMVLLSYADAHRKVKVYHARRLDRE